MHEIDIIKLKCIKNKQTRNVMNRKMHARGVQRVGMGVQGIKMHTGP
jgi:hypothetical protein